MTEQLQSVGPVFIEAEEPITAQFTVDLDPGPHSIYQMMVERLSWYYCPIINPAQPSPELRIEHLNLIIPLELRIK